MSTSTRPARHGAVVLLAMLVALLAGLCTATSATAAPVITPSGHHVVHDVHCVPSTPSDSATVRHLTAPGPVPVAPPPTAAPVTGPRGVCSPQDEPGAPAPGRSTLLAIGVDRN